MDIFPVSLSDFLFLFLLCLVSFLIGWFARRRKHSPPALIDETDETEDDIGLTTPKKTLRAIQTRGRGGEAVADSGKQASKAAVSKTKAGKLTEKPAPKPEEKETLE